MKQLFESILTSLNALPADELAMWITDYMSEMFGSLLAGAIGGIVTLMVAWHRLRRHRQSLQKGQDETVVNFSIEDLEPIEGGGHRLRILALAPEISIAEFVDNPALLDALGKAVKRTTVADPLVRFEDPYLTEALNRTIVNQVGGSFGWLNAFHVAGAKTRPVYFYFAPTWERGENVQWQKFRIIGVSQAQFDLITGQPETWRQGIVTQPGAAYQIDRLDTMAMIVRAYQAQQRSGQVGPVAQVLINLPLAFTQPSQHPIATGGPESDVR